MALALLIHMTNVSVMHLVIKVGDKGTNEDHWDAIDRFGSR